VPRRVPWILFLAGGAAGAPGRHLEYAESSNRLVCAFVFGSKDTCRVIRRRELPRLDLEKLLRRPPGPDYRGEPGDTVLAEFDFGRGGRPVHLALTNDGRYLVALNNRSPDGSAPVLDAVWDLRESHYAPKLDYGVLPSDPEPAWPPFERALAEEKETPAEQRPWDYGFVTLERDAGRLLVARQSEGADGVVAEIACFAVDTAGARVTAPTEEELTSLLEHPEPLFRAGAASGLGRGGGREQAAALKAALGHAEGGAYRAEFGAALVRCGDEAGRRMLRALLEEADPGARRAAALWLARLEPDRGDADALASALADVREDTAAWAGMALARLGKQSWGPVLRASRSTKAALRAGAARVLARIDDVEAEERLLALAGDADEEVSRQAAVALTAPPRAILPQNHEEFARALDAARRHKHGTATRRLSVLAAHAGIHHEKVLKALLDLTPFEEKAIWALAYLTREDLKTPEDCRDWWKRSRG